MINLLTFKCSYDELSDRYITSTIINGIQKELQVYNHRQMKFALKEISLPLEVKRAIAKHIANQAKKNMATMKIGTNKRKM